MFRNAVIILSLLQTIHAFLSSNDNFRPGPVKALLPKHPLLRERIPSDSSKQTLLKEGINYNTIDHSYNKRSTDGPFPPAHEEIFSDTNTNRSPPSFDPSPLPVQNAANVTPLKVMIFIDGTWLYYSMYGREGKRDIISQILGSNWRNEAVPDWNSLPAVACQALLRDPKSKWSSIAPLGNGDSDSTTATSRPIEVSRVSVYSSMYSDTKKDTLRYTMFQDMVKAGFDVNMMETKGRNEKGIDIQLAVDMLYYATVPDAYDVALLLTGDRDFLPAVIRCRQKGRRVGLVSMRSGSMSFENTPNLKDYDTIWLEDYLPQWIKQKPNARERPIVKQNEMPKGKPAQISSYTLNKVITNFILESGETLVSGRDMGRHLKRLSVSGTLLLDEIKRVYGGLYQFLIISKIYIVIPDARRSEKGFWVSLQKDRKIENSSQLLNAEEEKFLKTYEEWVPVDRDAEFHFTMKRTDESLSQSQLQKPEDDTPSVDYSELTVPELKEICREEGLRVSAKKKIDLVERIEAHMNSVKIQKATAKTSPSEYLESLTLEYLQASGGQASSRDIGRYLAANKGSAGPGTSALTELKEIYGNLAKFINEIPHFSVLPGPNSRPSRKPQEFNVCIDKASIKEAKLR